jgi:hypothetical protein
MAKPDGGPHLEPIADALITRSNGAFEPQFVRSLVAEIAADFDDVRVRDFLEVLITKEAADRLRNLQHVGAS